MTAVGVVGLGRMGGAMAVRLCETGFAPTVWNRTRSRCSGAEAAGATVAGTLAELAAAADVVVTSVADADALDVVLDELLPALRPGTVVVDTSTIGPEAARAAATRVERAGGLWLDAPVSGSTALAAQGALTTMVGGSSDALDRARPVLEALTKAVFHLGDAGSGAAMKLAVNAVVAVLNEAVAEGLALATASGIAPALAYDVLAGGAAGAPYVQYKRDAFVHPDETPVAFTVDLLAKDLDLILALAQRVGVSAPAVEAATDVLRRAQTDGLGGADMARVADVVRRRAVTANGAAPESN